MCKYFLLGLLTALLSCSTNKDNKDIYLSGDTIYINTLNINKMTESEIKQRFIDTGNSVYYLYFSYNNMERKFLYEFINANKYNNLGSNYDYYETFSLFYPSMKSGGLNLDSLDTISKRQVLSSLLKSTESGNVFACISLSNHYKYGNGVPKDIKKANELLEIAVHYKDYWKRKKNKDEVIVKLKGEVKYPIKNYDKNGMYDCFSVRDFGNRTDQLKICRQGDIQAYKRMKEFYKDQGVEREVIFYSIVMANKYKYPPAYFDVYMCLWNAFNGGKKAELSDMTRFDIKSKEFAMFYLKKAVESGNLQAREIIMKQY